MYLEPEFSEVFQLIWPYPIGQGLTIKEAANQLELDCSTIHRRINTFKDKYPEGYERFISARKLVSNARKSLKGGAEHGYSLEDYKSEIDNIERKTNNEW